MPNITTRLRTAVIVTLFITGAVRPALAQSQGAGGEDAAAFDKAAHNYALMHRRLEGVIGPITFGMSVEAINRNIQELAAAIRTERAGAPQGELFTPALGRLLRVRVNTALADHGYSAADVLAESNVAGVDYDRVRLRVNDTFPWILSVGMLPCVIDALPPLPSELQYRIVGGDLVLIDVHASLIVDILPGLLAELTVEDARAERGWR